MKGRRTAVEGLYYGDYGTKPAYLRQMLADIKQKVAILREELAATPPVDVRPEVLAAAEKLQYKIPRVEEANEKRVSTQKEIDRLTNSVDELKKLLDLEVMAWDTQDFEQWSEHQAKRKNWFYYTKWQNCPLCYYNGVIPEKILLLAARLKENLSDGSVCIRELNCWRVRHNEGIYRELPATKFLVWKGRYNTYSVAFWNT